MNGGIIFLCIIVGIVVAALLAIIPAGIAKNKGYSAGAWWAYGFFLFPLAFLHALHLRDLNIPLPNYSPNVAQEQNDAVGELEKLKGLFDQGIITEEEYQLKKEKLLKEI